MMFSTVKFKGKAGKNPVLYKIMLNLPEKY
jgi:hypothetical protein